MIRILFKYGVFSILVLKFNTNGLSQKDSLLNAEPFSENVDSILTLRFPDSSKTITGFYQGRVVSCRHYFHEKMLQESFHYKNLDIALTYAEDGISLQDIDITLDSTNRFMLGYSNPNRIYLKGGGYPKTKITEYIDERVSRTYEMKDGQFDGEFIYYDEEGNVSWYGEYLMGLRHGFHIEFYENGRIKSLHEFDHDIEKYKKLYFDEKGNVINRN